MIRRQDHDDVVTSFEQLAIRGALIALQLLFCPFTTAFMATAPLLLMPFSMVTVPFSCATENPASRNRASNIAKFFMAGLL
jgi:hypothetical protein